MEKQIILQNHLVNYNYLKANKSGLTLVFLHGWGSSSKIWDYYTTILSGKYSCLAFDLPGFGNSAPLKHPFNTSDYARSLSELLTKLNIEKYILISHSFGGSIVIKAVSKGLIKPISCIFISSSGIRKATIKKKFFSFISKILKPVLRNKKVKNSLYKLIGSTDYSNAKGFLKETFVSIVNEDLSNLVQKISTPTLLIWGNKDIDTPMIFGEFFKKEIKNSVLEILDGNHFVLLSKKEEVLKLLSSWIQKIKI